ncbi:hypothetical protein B1A85_13800 [Chroococcidiopsis sp. TS-821]|nr:hypothetical protein B1A85_13800 [Chroococcidiopsis sp. TS-821]
MVTDLRRCENCNLLFRTPTTTEEESIEFYQNTYKQGFTTDLPSDIQLQDLLNKKLVNTEKDYSKWIKILDLLGGVPQQRLLDYGCSWGYGSWQFREAGYGVTAFEISKPRCLYAKEKLGIDAKNSLSEIQGEFDIIFSPHVIEHLPSVSNYLTFAKNHLHPGGILDTVCPNGSEKFRDLNLKNYSKFWGLVHLQLPDEKFHTKYFGETNLLITSEPYNLSLFRNWDKSSLCLGDLTGSELLSVWAKPEKES